MVFSILDWWEDSIAIARVPSATYEKAERYGAKKEDLD